MQSSGNLRTINTKHEKSMIDIARINQLHPQNTCAHTHTHIYGEKLKNKPIQSDPTVT